MYYPFNIVKYVVVPVPYYRYSDPRKVIRSLFVVFDGGRMLPPVELDAEFIFRAIEVENVRTDGELSPKLQT